MTEPLARPPSELELPGSAGMESAVVVEVSEDAVSKDLARHGRIGQMVIGVKPSGAIVLRSPSVLSGKSLASQMKFILDVLASKAIRGNMDAIRAFLQHGRWAVEMKKGKAPQRNTHEYSGTVTVVDDLGSASPTVPVARMNEERVVPPKELGRVRRNPRPVGAPKRLPAGIIVDI